MTLYRRIDTYQENGITVVTFVERKILEAAHILELGEELLQLAEKDENKHLLLDFSSVEFLSSAALNKLIILDKKVKSKSGQLKLCNMMPEIREVFVITRLNQLFDIVDTREKAMEGFQRANLGSCVGSWTNASRKSSIPFISIFRSFARAWPAQNGNATKRAKSSG